MQTKWVSGRRFTEADDPDRVRIPWTPPDFISYQDPLKRREKLRVEKLDISRFRFESGHAEEESFASVVHGVFTDKECAQFIDAINKKVSCGVVTTCVLLRWLVLDFFIAEMCITCMSVVK